MVVEPIKQLAQLIRRQQIQQHQRVGLLGGLVPVDVVVLGFEDAVEALNVAVPLPVGVPIQFGQFVVTLELADHAVVERNEHPPADVDPSAQVPRRSARAFRAGPAGWQRHQLESLHGPQDHPHRHHIGVGVVVDALVRPVRVARMEFIGPDDSVDAVAIALSSYVALLTQNRAISISISAP